MGFALSWGALVILLLPSSSFAFLGNAGPLSRPSGTQTYMFDFLKPPDDKKETADSSTADPEENVASSDSDDPVEKIFSFFFGEKEENPMGMKRFGRGATRWQTG